MTNLDLLNIGRRIRQYRQSRQMTVEELAQAAELSKGLISKVENFRTLPSLPVLARISAALQVDMAELVRGVGVAESQRYRLVRRAEREPLEREAAEGFRYESLFNRELGERFFQSVILTLEPGARRQPVSTDGEEFLLVLAGTMELALGSEVIPMSAGDAIFFDGQIPHVTRHTGQGPAEMLVAYFLSRPSANG